MAALHVSGTACAGSWARGEGQVFFAQTTEYYFSQNDAFRFEQWVERGYIEFGLTDRTTMVGQIGYAQQSVLEADLQVMDASGLAEAEIGLSRAWSAEGGGTAAFRLGLSGRTRLVSDGRVTGGQDAAVEVVHGRGVGAENWFVDSEVGLRRSLGQDADSFLMEAGLGLKRGRAILLLQANSLRSFRNNEASGLDFDLTQFSLSGVVPVGRRRSLQIGARTDAFVRNLSRGNSLFLSFWWQI